MFCFFLHHNLSVLPSKDFTQLIRAQNCLAMTVRGPTKVPPQLNYFLGAYVFANPMSPREIKFRGIRNKSLEALLISVPPLMLVISNSIQSHFLFPFKSFSNCLQSAFSSQIMFNQIHFWDGSHILVWELLNMNFSPTRQALGGKNHVSLFIQSLDTSYGPNKKPSDKQ